MTTSATSESRFPLGCLGVTALVCSRLVTAITPWPRCLAPIAISTIEPLTPELEAMMNTSAGCRDRPSSNSATTDASRSSVAPARTDASRLP